MPNPGDRIVDWIAPLRWVCGLMFVFIVALTIAQVLWRFVLNNPLIWSEEVTRLLLVWMTFGTAAVVSYDGTHLCVDTFFVMLPPRLQLCVRVLNLACAVVFGAILAWYTMPLVMLAQSQSSGALDLSLAWYRAPALIGGVLIVATLALRWLYLVKRAPRQYDEAGNEVIETL
ncbi:MAG: TRAP transporter small permease [Proteobacteria bacterium]|nr:TRAP transporter small permease [Pseudomonadota bacterium]